MTPLPTILFFHLTVCTAMANIPVDPTLKTRILAAIDAQLATGRGMFTNELDQLNVLAVVDERTPSYADLVLTNESGYETPFFVWQFKAPILFALLELFHEGELCVKIVERPMMSVLSTSVFSGKPLLTDIVKQSKLKKQHWILLEVLRGHHREAGHWFFRDITSKSEIGFHWNDRPSNYCPLPETDEHVKK